MPRRGAHNQLGQDGETLAAEFLVGKGYQVLEYNLVMPQGEIDLLCQNEDVIVLVEVKTQRIAMTFNPIEKIDWQKQRKLRLLAQVIAARYPNRTVRIDAVTVYWVSGATKPVITHLENIL